MSVEPRKHAENVNGPSAFTDDGERHATDKFTLLLSPAISGRNWQSASFVIAASLSPRMPLRSREAGTHRFIERYIVARKHCSQPDIRTPKECFLDNYFSRFAIASISPRHGDKQEEHETIRLYKTPKYHLRISFMTAIPFNKAPPKKKKKYSIVLFQNTRFFFFFNR